MTNAKAAKPEYPADRWIRLTNINGSYVPGYAPEAVEDPLQAYKAFLHPTLEEAQKEFAGDMSERWGEIARGEREFEDAELDDQIESCTVHEDGTIALESYEITREEVFRIYAVTDVVAKPPQP